jgi:hypothetical protein
MIEAVELVLKDNFSIRVTANTKGAPFQILHRYVKENKSNPERDIKIQPHMYVQLRFVDNCTAAASFRSGREKLH